MSFNAFGTMDHIFVLRDLKVSTIIYFFWIRAIIKGRFKAPVFRYILSESIWVTGKNLLHKHTHTHIVKMCLDHHLSVTMGEGFLF